MAKSRRSTEELAEAVRWALNRPEDDDLLQFPDDYYRALTRAHEFFRSKIAQHYPNMLKEVTTITSSDDGETWPLSDDHHGQIEVYEPPGPPTGRRIFPALVDSGQDGFYIEGDNVKLTYPRSALTQLYIRWVPDTVADLDSEQEHALPAYCEEAMVQKAAEVLARRPGVLADAGVYESEWIKAWQGNPNDTSDMGVMGIIKRLAANAGIETAAARPPQPWYRGIGGR